MIIEITNIPKDKFSKINDEILKILVLNKIDNIKSIALNDLRNEYIGREYEITK